MDEPVKKKYNIAFAALLLIMLSAFYIWLSVVGHVFKGLMAFQT